MQKQKVPSSRHQPKGVIILYEDRDILVVDKSPGLLTISTEKGETNTAYYRLTDYVRKGCAKSRERIFIVHRLDRDVSGILVFARNVNAKTRLQEQWDQVEKKYLAVVHGSMAQKEATISSYLVDNKARMVHSTSDPTKGKLSHTAYRVMKETKLYSLLEINLLTGRKNQIRVHLAESGHPIVGDKKYGEGDKDLPRLALHAKSISFKHPHTGEQVAFETIVPPYFTKLVGGIDEKSLTEPKE